MNLKEYYKDAINNHYALGAFNFCNLESLKGILNAAKESNSPVIVATSESAVKYIGDEYLKHLILATKKTYDIPIFFHLDHGKDFEICKKAIKLGFDSVMIDGSSLTLKENIELTKKVVDYAHKHNVQVEGELGRLLGIEDDVCSDKSIYTSPDEAKIFVEQTNVDSLAIAIGTSHGINKFQNEPKLAIDVLKKIQRKIPNTPLVLHGASSVDENVIKQINNLGGNIKKAKGVSANILFDVCKNYNICKINVDTDIRMATVLALKQYFNAFSDSVDAKKLFGEVQKAISNLVSFKIQHVFNSKNRIKKGR